MPGEFKEIDVPLNLDWNNDEFTNQDLEKANLGRNDKMLKEIFSYYEDGSFSNSEAKSIYEKYNQELQLLAWNNDGVKYNLSLETARWVRLALREIQEFKDSKAEFDKLSMEEKRVVQERLGFKFDWDFWAWNFVRFNKILRDTWLSVSEYFEQLKMFDYAVAKSPDKLEKVFRDINSPFLNDSLTPFVKDIYSTLKAKNISLNMWDILILDKWGEFLKVEREGQILHSFDLWQDIYDSQYEEKENPIAESLTKAKEESEEKKDWFDWRVEAVDYVNSLIEKYKTNESKLADSFRWKWILEGAYNFAKQIFDWYVYTRENKPLELRKDLFEIVNGIQSETERTAFVVDVCSSLRLMWENWILLLRDMFTEKVDLWDGAEYFTVNFWTEEAWNSVPSHLFENYLRPVHLFWDMEEIIFKNRKYYKQEPKSDESIPVYTDDSWVKLWFDDGAKVFPDTEILRKYELYNWSQREFLRAFDWANDKFLNDLLHNEMWIKSLRKLERNALLANRHAETGFDQWAKSKTWADWIGQIAISSLNDMLYLPSQNADKAWRQDDYYNIFRELFSDNWDEMISQIKVEVLKDAFGLLKTEVMKGDWNVDVNAFSKAIQTIISSIKWRIVDWKRVNDIPRDPFVEMFISAAYHKQMLNHAEPKVSSWKSVPDIITWKDKGEISSARFLNRILPNAKKYVDLSLNALSNDLENSWIDYRFTKEDSDLIKWILDWSIKWDSEYSKYVVNFIAYFNYNWSKNIGSTYKIEERFRHAIKATLFFIWRDKAESKEK